MGHSQGARIVAEMTNMRDIAKFVYLSASPLGRLFYAGVDSPAYDQILSMETSQTELERNFEKGDSYQTWRSFSYSPLVPIATTTKPFLIVYGSEDRSCVYCDAFFSLKWKNPNISLIKYEGLDHVFNDSNQNSHWKIVMADIDEWIENKR